MVISSERDSFILSESLSEEALQILLGKGLGNKRNQDAVSEFRNSRRVADEAFRAQIKAREDEIRQKLQDNNARLVRALQRALVKSVLMTFRYAAFCLVHNIKELSHS